MGLEGISREIGTFYIGGTPMADLTIVDGVLEIDALDELAGPITTAIFGKTAIELNVGIPKGWRFRSRKRFIKLVMSYGIPRNLANNLSSITRLPGKSYQTALFDALYYLSSFMRAETN